MGVGLVGIVERSSPCTPTTSKQERAMHKQPARTRVSRKLLVRGKHHHSLFSCLTYTGQRSTAHSSLQSTTTRTGSRTVARRSTLTLFYQQACLCLVKLASPLLSSLVLRPLSHTNSNSSAPSRCRYTSPSPHLTSPRRHGLPRRRPRQPAVQRAHVTVDFARKLAFELRRRQAHSFTTARNPHLRRDTHHVPQNQDFLAYQTEPAYTSTIARKLTERLASTRRCRFLHALRQGRPSARQATTRRAKGAHHAISRLAP
jgi:hypothetical protein